VRIPLRVLILGVGCIAAGGSVRAQDLIDIDQGTSLAEVSRKPIGVNLNYLLDDDGNRPQALRRLADALRLAGVKYLRYPGGEKSDAYLWSIPPFTASHPTLARWVPGDWPQNNEWPSDDRALVAADGHTLRTDPLDFDEFMDVCREIDCVPTIVVCYDSMYKLAQPGGVAPTRAQLIDTAREWVRYANITKGYGIRYWEIGNESYLRSYNGGATASDYARDLIAFSQSMKSVDATIRIGANGHADEWWRTVLPLAAPFIDFLAVHNYPAYGRQSYAEYSGNRVELSSVVQTARAAIAAYAPAADRGRLTIAVTEAGAASWSGVWPDVNDLGHALLFADLLGEQLQDPLVEYSQLWTTRWSGNDRATTPAVWDAFDKDNQLQATGQVLALWNSALTGRMVQSTGTALVRSYATVSADGVVRVMLINRDTAARPVVVSGVSAPAALRTQVFGGTDPADLYPFTTDGGSRDIDTAPASLTLAPVSITMLEFTPRASPAGHTVPGRVEAEDFDANGYWDTTPINKGGRYRTTAVDIETTTDVGGGFDVGWIAAGEWLEYTIYVPRAASYRIAIRAASVWDNAWLSISVDASLQQPLVSVRNTGGWQNWATLETSATLSAGRHVVRVATATGGFNLNWLDFQEISSPRPVGVAGAIEAEDFDEGRYYDTSAGNTGGEYRATDVDLERTTDAGGGFNVGWIRPGEWVEYTIDVQASTTYILSLRVASIWSTAVVQVSIDGRVDPGEQDVPNTGAWQAWQTIDTPAVSMTAGRHTVRIATRTGGFNLNWIRWR
jgi:hypothetical protein